MAVSKVKEGLPNVNDLWSIPICALCGKSLWRGKEVKVIPGPPRTVLGFEMETEVTVIDGDFHDSCPDCGPEPDAIVERQNGRRD